MKQPRYRVYVTLMIVALLSACNPASVVPTPQPTVAATEAPPAPSAIPTVTAFPSVSPPPTATSAPTQTAIAFPAPSATPVFPTAQLDASNFAAIELLRSEGFGQAQAVALSPDNRWLAVTTSAGIAWFDPTTLEHLRFDPIDGGASKIRFSDDSRLIELLVGGPFRPERIQQRWVANSEVIEDRPPPPPSEFQRIFFSPDEQLRAELNVPDSVPTPGVRVFRSSDDSEIYRDETTQYVGFSADSRLILLVDYRGTVHLIDSADGSQRSIDLPGYAAVAFSPDALSLIAAGSDLRVWDVVAGELRSAPQPLTFGSMPGLLGIRQRIEFNAAGNLLTIDGGYAVFEAELRRGETWQFASDSLVPIWQQDAIGAGFMTYETYVGALSPADPITAVSSDGRTLTISGPAIQLDLPFETQISALAFSPDGTQLAVADRAGTLHLLAANSGEVIDRLALDGPIVQLVFSPDGSRLGAVRTDGTLIVQPLDQDRAATSIANVQPALEDGNPAIWPARIRFSPDGSLLLAWDPSGGRFYRLEDGALLHTISGRISDMAIGPQRRMAAILRDGRIELWGVR